MTVKSLACASNSRADRELLDHHRGDSRLVRKSAVQLRRGWSADRIIKPIDPSDERIYNLNLLGRRGFNFVYDPGSGIEDVTIR